MADNRFIDRVGERYGMLVILSFEGVHINAAGQHRRLWLCQCDCGNTKVLKFSDMSGNHTRSCGCLNKAVNLGNTYQQKASGVSAFNQIYAAYKKSARYRNLPFELAEHEFRTLTQSNCFYCGLPPSQVGATVKETNGEYIYTGIDRIDNTRGYTLDNVRPCCKQCNYAKRNLTEQEFHEWLQRVVNCYLKLEVQHGIVN